MGINMDAENARPKIKGANSSGMTNDEIKNAIRENNAKFIRLQFVDINGCKKYGFACRAD
ncbi:MAG: hypothetical protein MZU95_04530 [Desulfomicrobium escambiense]|nr:hypothetical protein [Desulfomicrobium escambiense]